MEGPKKKKVKYDEVVKTYTPEEMKQHHDDALTYYIEKEGIVSVKVLSRVGKVPQKYIRKWMKEEKWEQYVMEDEGDKIKVSDKTREFIQSAAEKYNLSEREELFCYHYFKCKNATQAAMRAGYEPTWCYNAGYNLLAKPHIKGFLREIQSQACAEIYVDQLDVLKMWAKIAFADMNDYVSVSGAGVVLKNSKQTDGQVVAEIKEGKDGVTIKLADRMKALDRLSSYFKVLPGDQAQDLKVQILQKAAAGDQEEEPLKIEIVGV